MVQQPGGNPQYVNYASPVTAEGAPQQQQMQFATYYNPYHNQHIGMIQQTANPYSAPSNSSSNSGSNGNNSSGAGNAANSGSANTQNNHSAPHTPSPMPQQQQQAVSNAPQQATTQAASVAPQPLLFANHPIYAAHPHQLAAAYNNFMPSYLPPGQQAPGNQQQALALAQQMIQQQQQQQISQTSQQIPQQPTYAAYSLPPAQFGIYFTKK